LTAINKSDVRRKEELEMEYRRRKEEYDMKRQRDEQEVALKVNDEELQRLDEESQRLEQEYKEDVEQKQHELNQLKEEQRKREQEEEQENRRRAERQRKEREEADRLANSAGEQERTRQKELLLAKMKAIDEGKHQEDINNAAGDIFVTSPAHNGFVPSANVQIKFRPQPVDANGLPSFGDYKPSFLSTGSGKPKAPGRGVGRRGFEFESTNDDIPVAGDNGGDVVDDEPVEIFGSHGGSVREGLPESRKPNDGLLHRPKQPINTFKTTMSNAADYDDDIEEVLL